ncbi:MAG: G5 domain-containing protein [Bifidobacteriaceae bacterium]|jgi:hypothetical protein|nr:G5 domain-containing protein [Bifidobacteriaceae bacterium]
MAKRFLKPKQLHKKLFDVANLHNRLNNSKHFGKIHGFVLAAQSVLGLRRIAKVFVCLFLFFALAGLFTTSMGSKVTEALSNSEQGQVNPEAFLNTSIHKIILDYEGIETQFYSSAEKVSDVLYQRDIIVSFNYGVYPDISTPVDRDMKIFVGPIKTNLETKNQVVKYKTKEIKDSTMPKGYKNKSQNGQDGQSNITYLVQYIGAQEISRSAFTESIETPVQDETWIVGTMDLPDPASAVYSGDESRGFARSQFSSFGWSLSEFVCLDQLWERESHWNVHAANGASGAYGIPQALPGSKMSAYGADWQNNAQTQVKWGLHYIQDRYSTPCGAWSHSQLFGWY